MLRLELDTDGPCALPKLLSDLFKPLAFRSYLLYMHKSATNRPENYSYSEKAKTKEDQ